MKKIFILSLCIFVFLGSKAQITAEAMMSKIPAITEPCQMTLDQKQAYLDELDEVSKQIEEELDKRDQAMNDKQGDFEAQAKANMAKQYGISQSDVDRMEGGMSDAEKAAMADKMLQNSTNISMAEIENLKKMDKTGQEAWMEAYSTEKMAEQSGNETQVRKEQLKHKNQYDLANMQKHLLDSLMAIEDKYGKKIQKINADSENVLLRKEIDSLRARLGSLMGIDYGQGGEMDNIQSMIKSKSLIYCSKFSEEYIPVLKDYRDYTTRSFSALNRLQDISEQLTEMQTGVKMENIPGTMALVKVKDLIHRMKDSFSHYLMSQHEAIY